MVKTDLKWTEVQSVEIQQTKFRLEASVFNIEARSAHDLIKQAKYPIVKLWSENGLVKSAFYPGRFKRIYVEKGNGYPMVLPSQMLSIKPIPTKFISLKTTGNLDILKVKKGTLLITRSGTIGNCTIVTDTLEGVTMSDDVIRVSFKDDFGLGYTYAYLLTKIGKVILATNNYGTVVQHIEPEHLEDLPIPNAPDEIKKDIHEKVMKSFELRDVGNRLIEQAENLLLAELKLPPFDDLKPDLYAPNVDVQTYTVNLSLLNDRFDGSYHVPIVSKIIDCLLDSGAKILPLGDKELSEKIIMAGRFKRIYLGEDEGVVFLGGKQIHELDPSGKKFLSIKHHEKRIYSELFLKENFIVVTCSGTIGKVNIVPKHWENWTMSQHVLRIVPRSKLMAGYIFSWLNSEYGQALIKRYTYGSVVDEINDNHLSQVPIPIINGQAEILKISELVFQANKLRTEAYEIEQAAIKQVNEDVIFAK